MSNSFGFQIEPIPDETAFGLIVAMGVLAGCETYSQAYSSVLGKWTTCPASMLPRGLQRLSEFLPRRYLDDTDTICYEHTVLPYFQHFSKADGILRAKEAMLTGKGTSIRHDVGLTKTTILDSRSLKYCSACSAEQWAVYDRATWLRSHQLPGVEVCHMHGLPLIESSISTDPYWCRAGGIQLPSGSESLESRKIWKVGDPWDKTSPTRLIAQISHELLIRRPQSGNHCARGRAYRQAFVRAGYGSERAVDWIKVENALRAKYGDLIPKKLGITFTNRRGSYSHWLRRLTAYTEHTQHPLLHILLIGALFESLDHLDEATERESEKSMRRTNIVPPLPDSLSPISLSPECVSLSKLELASSMSAETARPESAIIDQLKLKHRQALLEVLHSDPSSTRTQLRNKVEVSYKWLLRNDRAWAHSCLPSKAKSIAVVRREANHEIINWASLDATLAVVIGELSPHDFLRMVKGGVKINLAKLSRLSKFSYDHVKKLSHYPQTAAALTRIRLQTQPYDCVPA